jgi:hypothetical protein
VVTEAILSIRVGLGRVYDHVHYIENNGSRLPGGSLMLDGSFDNSSK